MIKRWLKAKWHDFWVGYHYKKVKELDKPHQYHVEMLNYHLNKLVKLEEMQNGN